MLILEFPLVKRTKDSAPRRVDGLILPEAPHRMVRWRPHRAEVDTTVEEVIKGIHIVAVQVKPHRLDLPLLGQTFFAVELLWRFRPASVRGVALCTQSDSALQEVFESFPNMKVEVDST